MLCFHKVKVKIMARLVANILERSPPIRTQLLYICMYGGKFELPMMDDGTFALFVGRSNYASLENKNPLVPSPSLSNSFKVCRCYSLGSSCSPFSIDHIYVFKNRIV